MKKMFFLLAFCTLPLLPAATDRQIPAIYFEPHADKFVARVGARTVALSSREVSFDQMRLKLIGGNTIAQGEGIGKLPGVSNYYLGNDPAKWRQNVSHYAKVRYRNIYPGIDIVYYTKGRNIEFDFEIAPRANPDLIELAWDGAGEPSTDRDGNLIFAPGPHEIHQRRPRVYQQGREISSSYEIGAAGHVRFKLNSYDTTLPLLVDPVIEWATYLGGNGFDVASAVAVDSKGSAYITGFLQSPSFPNLDPSRQTGGTGQDVVVAKFTPSGNALVYYTYVGGSALDAGNAIAIDASGNAYVAGFTQSNDFPVLNAAQPTYGGGFRNGCVFKVSPTGRLIYSTYIGGNNEDNLNSIAVDATGSAFVTGYTYSGDFPIKNALQPTMTGRPDAIVAKLSPAGNQFLFSTFLGGANPDYGRSVAVAPNGSIWVGGSTQSDDFPVLNPLQAKLKGLSYPTNAFIANISTAGDKLLYSTYLGGNAFSTVSSLKIDRNGNPVILGGTNGDFPTKNPIQASLAGQVDLTLTRLSAAGDSILFSTYFGGSDDDYLGNLALDANDNIYITGFTYSSDFPIKNSLQSFIGATSSFKTDAFIVKISPDGGLVYSTLTGGHGDDRGVGIAVDPQGGVYVAGLTTSEDFPVRNAFQANFGGGPGDMFVLKLSPEVAIPSPVRLSPEALPFRYVMGGPPPPAQLVSVTSTGAAANITAASNSQWITVRSNSTTTPATLTVSVDPSALAPGSYAGAIQVDASNAIQVTFTVLSPAPVLNAVSPGIVALGSEDKIVTVTGSGFVPGAVVQVNGTPQSTTLVDANTVKFTAPKTLFVLQNALSITVVNPHSEISNPITLAVGAPTPQFSAAGVVNAASFVAGPVAPGEIVTIFGTNLDKTVTFDGIPATLIYFSPTQVSVTVPYATAANATTVIRVGSSAPVTLNVAAAAPGIFAAVPAGAGVLTLYTTGGGALSSDPLPLIQLPVSVTANGQDAQVLYAGIAPGLAEGANQINILLPNAAPSGAITLVLKVGSAASKEFSVTLP
jgi:uncharacterized protein (TIGR03437 family)